jgi:hypothetical protein
MITTAVAKGSQRRLVLRVGCAADDPTDRGRLRRMPLLENVLQHRIDTSEVTPRPVATDVSHQHELA